VEARDSSACHAACSRNSVINASSFMRFTLPGCEMQSPSRSRWENLLENGEKHRLSRIRAIFQPEYVFRERRAFLSLAPIDSFCISRFFTRSRFFLLLFSYIHRRRRFRDLLSQCRFLCDAASVALCCALPRSLSVCACC